MQDSSEVMALASQNSVDILIQSLKYLQKEENLKLYAYVFLENHIHLIVQSNDIGRSIRHFKTLTKRTCRETVKAI